MQFFSVFDLLVKHATEKGDSVESLYSFFRTKRIKRELLLSLRQTSFLPTDEPFQQAICEYLEMSPLEIELSMGRIPAAYRHSFFSNAKQIAGLLTAEEPAPFSQITPYFKTDLGTLYNDDCISVLKSMPDACVDLVFADPPFNLGKTYDPGIDDSLSMSQYLNWTYQWLDECVRILKPGGRIFIYNIPKWCVYIAAHLSEVLTFWAWIAVDMKFSLPIQNRLYPAHYALVSFVKGTKATTFNNQRIPLQTCRHCGGEIKDYGGYKGKMNPLGVNVSDVWTDIYPVRHKNSKNREYNELSVKLLDRIISMGTNEGDTVFDPFGGSGTTYAVAEILNRKWIGCELGDCAIIEERIRHPHRDIDQIKKLREESGALFPPKVADLRRKNGFWICEDVSKSNPTNKKNDQLMLDFEMEP